MSGEFIELAVTGDPQLLEKELVESMNSGIMRRDKRERYPLNGPETSSCCSRHEYITP